MEQRAEKSDLLVVVSTRSLLRHRVGEESAGERRPRDRSYAEVVEGRKHLSLLFTVSKVVMVLHGDERCELIVDRVILHDVDFGNISQNRRSSTENVWSLHW